jgi:hypothetical protein
MSAEFAFEAVILVLGLAATWLVVRDRLRAQ